MGNRYKINVQVNVIPCLMRTEYNAKFFADLREETPAMVMLEGENMQDLLLKVKEELEKRNISRSDAYIWGEFLDSELTEADQDAWGTPLSELSDIA